MKRLMLILVIIASCVYGVLLVYENSDEQISNDKMEQSLTKSANDVLNQNYEVSKLNNGGMKVSDQSKAASKEFNHKFAYILNSNSTTISKCNINQTSGQLEDCVKVGHGFNAPTGIAVSKNHLWMYITNRGENNVLICQIEPQAGELANCHPTNNEEFNKPTGITLDEVNDVAYITNVGNDTVSRCNIKPSDMELTDCIQYHNQYLNNPTDIKLGLNNSDVFVVNAGSNSIVRCAFDEENQTFNCNKILSGLSNPQAIFFAKDHIYIPNLASKSVTICPSKLRDSEIVDCTNLSGDFGNATDVFVTGNEKNVIYITDEQKVLMCERKENNSILKCQPTGGGFNAPSGIYVLEPL